MLEDVEILLSSTISHYVHKMIVSNKSGEE